MVYGKPAVSLGEHLFAQVALFGFYGLCGVIFAFSIPYISVKTFTSRLPLGHLCLVLFSCGYGTL